MTLNGDEPELALGDSGEHVLQLQDRLRALRLLDKYPDGTYDDATETAVRQMQSNLGQDNDGKITQQTWEKLDEHMLQNGLTYNHYAGAGNQHWDQLDDTQHEAWGNQDGSGGGATAGAVDANDPSGQVYQQGYEEGQYRWDGQNWQPISGDSSHGHADTQAQEQALSGDVGQVSVDGMWRWDGKTWQANGEHQGAEHPAAEHQAGEAPVIPHFDNIHPAIQQDERFSDFHDFLREQSG